MTAHETSTNPSGPSPAAYVFLLSIPAWCFLEEHPDPAWGSTRAGVTLAIAIALGYVAAVHIVRRKPKSIVGQLGLVLYTLVLVGFVAGHTMRLLR